MAAHRSHIFQSEVEAQQPMRAAFLETVAQKLYGQGGLEASILHPRHLSTPEKAFFERAFNSITEDSEQDRFTGWLSTNVKLEEFNTVLQEQTSLPNGISLQDFNVFVGLHGRQAIIDFVLTYISEKKEAHRHLTASYAEIER